MKSENVEIRWGILAMVTVVNVAVTSARRNIAPELPHTLETWFLIVNFLALGHYDISLYK